MKGLTRDVVAVTLISITVGSVLIFALGSFVTGPPHQTQTQTQTQTQILTQTHTHVLSPRIAFVKPTFTVAAYHKLFDPPSFPDSFYKFYMDQISVAQGVNVTSASELYLLTSNVTSADQIVSSSAERSEYQFLSLANRLDSLLSPLSVTVLTDADLDKGSVFQNGTNGPENAYQILVLGHQEYVTSDEYRNIEKFVANGGVLILVDGNVFAAVVNYDRNTQSITFMEGHGWAYNGNTAWKTNYEYWASENDRFIGSNPCNPLLDNANFTLTNNPFGVDVRTGEEQCVSGTGNLILINYGSSDPQHVVAAYSRDYGKGKVFSFGIYGEDVLYNGPFLNFFEHIVEGALNTFTFEKTLTTCSSRILPVNFSRVEAWNFKAGTQFSLSSSSNTISFNGTSNAGGGLGVLVRPGTQFRLGGTLLMNLSSSQKGLLEIILYDNVTNPTNNYVLWIVPINIGAQQLEMSLDEGQTQGNFQVGLVEGILLQLRIQPAQSASVTFGQLATNDVQTC